MMNAQVRLGHTDSRIQRIRPEIGARRGAGPTTRSKSAQIGRGFSLIDVLVTIAIIAVLMGILLPSLSAVNETARRVACRSNIRQIGLALVTFADQNGGLLPTSVYLPPTLRTNLPFAPRTNWAAEPQNMMTLNVPPERKIGAISWDGLGILFADEYLPTPKIFYCPSHRGAHPYSRYAQVWGNQEDAELVGNYHYRGFGPMYSVEANAALAASVPMTRDLDKIYPRMTALVSDGMQTRLDYNHKVGVNVFRADLSADWFSDPSGRIGRSLPNNRSDANAGSAVEDAWRSLDSGPTAE
jgi:prepilin-type N-terminal cleavage/methylation domain-containing protein